MAANMKSVKLRIKSVQSTMQITKAMELVASSKLRKAKERAETCRPYFRELHQTLQDIAQDNTDFSSIYAKEAENEKYCYVVIAGDRGLAGDTMQICSNVWKRRVPVRIMWFCLLEKSSRIFPSERNSMRDGGIRRDCGYFCGGLFRNGKPAVCGIPERCVWAY